MTYDEIISNAEHFKALGQTEIWHDEPDFPLDKVSRVELAGPYYCGVPANLILTVVEHGLTVRRLFNLMDRFSHSQFDAAALALLGSELPQAARDQLTLVFETEILPEVRKWVDEARKHYVNTMVAEVRVESFLLGSPQNALPASA